MTDVTDMHSLITSETGFTATDTGLLRNCALGAGSVVAGMVPGTLGRVCRLEISGGVSSWGSGAVSCCTSRLILAFAVAGCWSDAVALAGVYKSELSRPSSNRLEL